MNVSIEGKTSLALAGVSSTFVDHILASILGEKAQLSTHMQSNETTRAHLTEVLFDSVDVGSDESADDSSQSSWDSVDEILT